MAKRCTKCGIEKAFDAFSPRRAAADGLHSQCKRCNADYSKERALSSPEKVAASQAKWYSKNAEQERLNARIHYDKNAVQLRAESLARHRANPERSKKNAAVWQEKNRAYVNSRTAKRRALHVSVQPAWANSFFIREAYDIARVRSKATGFTWNVDHVVPLKGKTVCGLHVESNLQVIPKVENLRKGNYFWPDMWGDQCLL